MNNLDNIVYDSPELKFERDFWDAMRGRKIVIDDQLKRHEAGGSSYTLPIGADAKFIELMKKRNVFRRSASVINVYNGTYKMLAKDTSDVTTWVPEGEEIPVQDAMTDFNTVFSEVSKLASIIKMEEQFSNDNHFDIQEYLIDRLSKTFARAEEDAFINGSGSGAPHGILGSSEGAEVGVETSSLTYDDVIKLYFSLAPEYRTEGIWLMNDETAYALRTMKDDAGNYLWRTSDDTILGKPVCISEYMPGIESGKSPIIFGDFSYYWIIVRRPLAVTVLTELFAKHNQIGYLANELLDGFLIRKSAIKTLAIK